MTDSSDVTSCSFCSKEDKNMFQIPQIYSSTSQEVLATIGDLVLFNENIGNGTFASVHQAEYKGTICAAKMLLRNATDMMMATTQFTTATDPIKDSAKRSILKDCSFLEKLKHDNIIQHITTAIEPKSGLPILVMELMDCNLQKFITDHRPLSLQLQLTICHSVSCGLHYLHTNNIIHRDLCDHNILLKLSPELTVKISDFGMSTILDYDSISATLTAVDHKKGYLPPEGQGNDSSSEDDDDEDDSGSKACYSHHLDIYSFGAIATQTVQSADHFKTRKVLKRSFKRIPDEHPLKLTIENCIQEEPKHRPSAEFLKDQIATLKIQCRWFY